MCRYISIISSIIARQLISSESQLCIFCENPSSGFIVLVIIGKTIVAIR